MLLERRFDAVPRQRVRTEGLQRADQRDRECLGAKRATILVCLAAGQLREPAQIRRVGFFERLPGAGRKVLGDDLIAERGVGDEFEAARARRRRRGTPGFLERAEVEFVQGADRGLGAQIDLVAQHQRCLGQRHFRLQRLRVLGERLEFVGDARQQVGHDVGKPQTSGLPDVIEQCVLFR